MTGLADVFFRDFRQAAQSESVKTSRFKHDSSIAYRHINRGLPFEYWPNLCSLRRLPVVGLDISLLISLVGSWMSGLSKAR